MVSQKFCCIKEACGYAKVIHEKRKRRSIRKNEQVSEIFKTMGTPMSA
jgi:Zn ribbon nucleic-acid-binding protein